MNQIDAFNHIVGRTAILYGESGTGKTRECAALALYMAQTHKLKTRYITADGGGMEPMQSLIEAGIVEAWSLAGDPEFYTKLTGASKGLWPGVGGKYTNDYTGVGCLIVESISGLSAEMMNYLLRTGAAMTQDPGSNAVLTVSKELKEAGLDKVTVTSPSQSHYGAVGRDVLQLLRNFQNLALRFPDLQQILFTSHLAAGADKSGGSARTVLGPSAVGKVITAQLPQMVGDMLYLAAIPDKAKGTTEYRAYFTPYPDVELAGKTWPARLRASATVTAQLAKLHPKGYIVLTNEDDPLVRKGVSVLWEARRNTTNDDANRLKELVKFI